MSALSPGQWNFLLCLACRIVPEAGQLDEPGRQAFRAIVDEALLERPPGLQRQFRLFLGVLRWAPALRYLAPLDSLAAAKQDAVLAWFQDCPVTLVRKGFWGLKSLVFMGFYSRPEAAAVIGYRPSRNGNAKLGAAV